MFEIEYHKLEQLGTLERSHICFETLEDAREMAETIRQETGIIVEITEIKEV